MLSRMFAKRDSATSSASSYLSSLILGPFRQCIVGMLVCGWEGHRAVNNFSVQKVNLFGLSLVTERTGLRDILGCFERFVMARNG